jgi:hypothetical protein
MDAVGNRLIVPLLGIVPWYPFVSNALSTADWCSLLRVGKCVDFKRMMFIVFYKCPKIAINFFEFSVIYPQHSATEG